MEDRDPRPSAHAPAPRLALFRTPAKGDTYEAALAAYTPTTIAAIADRVLPAPLAPVLRAGAGKWEAVVITSRRAAEAWVAAARGAVPDDGAEPWSALTVYTAGGAPLRVLDDAALPAHFRPVPGPATYSAATLAPVLLDTPPREAPAYRPYLLLTGDKTLPTLGDALAGAGRAAVKLQVYETERAATLAADIARLGPGLRWAAFFAPSSTSYALPLLEDAGFRLRGEHPRLRVAAIGETTAAYLRDRGYAIDAVAATPDAAGLHAAIDAADAAERSAAEHAEQAETVP